MQLKNDNISFYKLNFFQQMLYLKLEKFLTNFQRVKIIAIFKK